MSNPPTADKVSERQMDLLIALVHAPQPLSRAEILTQVAGYDLSADPRAVTQMFERDKAALRDIGVPLVVTTAATHGDDQRYSIDPDSYALVDLALSPVQASVVAIAAGLWRQTDLDEVAGRGLTKLRAVVESDAGGWRSALPALGGGAEPALMALIPAIDARLVVEFSYQGSRDERPSRRLVEPWLVSPRAGAWYLLGYDRQRGEQRTYRLSRIVGEVKQLEQQASQRRPQRLPSLAAQGQQVTVQVRLAANQGRGLQLRAVASWTQGPDTFLTFADDFGLREELAALGAAAQVLAPPELAADVARSHRQLLAAPSLPVSLTPPPLRRQRRKATARLTRMLALVAYLERHVEVPVAQAAAHFGVSEAEILRDVSTLFVSGRPGYLPDDLLDFDVDAAERRTLRLVEAQGMGTPLRLTATEAATLVIALRVLAALAPGPEVEETLSRLQEAVGQASGDKDAVRPPTAPQVPTSVYLQAIAAGHGVEIDYVDALGQPSRRVVVPRSLSTAGTATYLEAYCTFSRAPRCFRLDRIAAARAVGPVTVPAHPPAASASATARVALGLTEAGAWIGELEHVEVQGETCIATGYSPTWLAHWMLGIGTFVTSLTPLDAGGAEALSLARAAAGAYLEAQKGLQAAAAHP
ncbi:WYL domain-containing protein [Buchananella hordeovulneris]|uniref:WYL domain-containing protein n=1 Tax=Buchananella hordeovulneris TaxID=52770 RepID=UPI0026DBB831|nr:WYL domain-containing protein [Buchananella hordeovulneris]MDO5079675.1 WYL domain-containing protein [Buchananella hordeovulneris]